MKITGNNTSPNKKEEKISMTVPVTMEARPKDKSEKISMTAPVNLSQDGEKWRMHFVMPSEYTLETLPKPNNPAINIRKLPASNYAVIRFAGLTGAKKVDSKTNELLAWMAEKDLKPKSQPELARYDQPWTLPFKRRNEVMIKY